MFWMPLLLTLAGFTTPILDETNKTALALETYLDQRFLPPNEANAATEKLLQLLEKEKIDAAGLEKLIRQGRIQYPAPPEKGKLYLKRKLVCDYVDYETQFFLYVPKSYDATKAHPLLVIAHGGNGAMDAEYAKMAASSGLRPWLKLAEEHGFLVVAPLSERGWMTIGDAIIQTVISKMQREFHVDADRIYLTGHSMGGHLTYRSALFMADRWAAVSPMSGGYDYVANEQIYNLWNVPGYVTFGKQEPYKIDQFNRTMREWTKARGYPWTFMEKDGGHEIFGDELPKVARFFLDHPRHLYPKLVYVHRNDGLEHVSADANPRWNKTHAWKEHTVIDRSTTHWLQLCPLPAGTKNEQSMQTVRAEVTKPNEITITSQHARQLRVLLHPKLVDMTRPVVVKINGKEVHTSVVKPDLGQMLEMVRRFDDRGRIFWGALEFEVKDDAKVAEPRS
jgi:pimeloyl-ACP methyl ester carboxylesterase